jgi:hypothetical protein
MVMVEYFANPPTCALGDLACTLDGTDADVLTGHTRTLADIASSVEWVKCDQIPRPFPNTLARRSDALGGSFADVSGAPANVATRAGLLGLLSGSPGCVGSLRRRLALASLADGARAAEANCKCEERDAWSCEWDEHGLNLPSV